MLTQRRYWYFLSFIEGASVMAVELVGAKLLAPYFGTSLYVWAAALGTTLGGLTLGYFLGGRLSRRTPGDATVLYRVIVLAGLAAMVMPYTSHWAMEAASGLPLQTGATLSLTAFMVPPLLLMGMVSPLIINLLTREAVGAGNSAGNVYAISTLGGILATFLMGFYVIPAFGLRWPIITVGALLALGPAISLLRNRSLKLPAALVAAVIALPVALSTLSVEAENYDVLYESEGILGQLKVVDHPAYEFTEDERIGRALIVNNTLQTIMDLETNYSIWNWAHYFPAAASVYPPGSKVLLLGLGGGTLVKQLESLGFNVDVVEIDERIKDVCIRFFNVSPEVNLHVDDARHYVRTTEKQYDVIIYDTFLSESVPEHLLTLEGFGDAERILRPGGMIMANFYGFLDGVKGTAARSVFKTFQAAGFITELMATPGADLDRNLIFLASRQPLDFDNISYKEGNYPIITSLYPFLVDPAHINTDAAYVLTDERPMLAKLYLPAALAWKNGYRQYYRKHFGI